tara:strand:- start:218 stop:892 length:675 start_codon:yes stop_codon:yes gene_type:complete
MSFMPEVKMDFMPEDMSEEETIEVEEFNEDKDKTQEEIEEIQEQEPPLPKAKSKRDDMNINEIFNIPESVPNEPIKLTKKGKPRKKRPPMSEEHKAKLALAREKAMLARKKKAQEKKENKALELEEKELLKKQKVKRVKKLKEEVEEDTPQQPPPEIKREPTFTKKDLEEAQLQAIMNYEKIRKSRKEEKRIKQEKEREQEALKAQIRRAVAPPQEYNPFANCY